MIRGHGDDAYRYEGVKICSDFSSNICARAGHAELTAHLSRTMAGLISHYPEPEAWSLEQAIAAHHQIAPNCVIVTNGATEAIYLVAQTFRMEPTICTPTFREYEDACQMFPPVDHGHRALWCCSPNNPDGRAVAPACLDSLPAAPYDLYVIDCSYAAYTHSECFTPRLAVGTDDMVLVCSFTKTYAVPGLRLGYIVAAPRLAALLRRHLRPWSVSALAVEAGKYLLAHQELRVCPDFQEAARLRTLLNAIPGITVSPTDTTFMLCHIEGHSAAELKDWLLRRHGLLIRDASNFTGLLPGHFRVASQSPGENDALVSAVSSFCHSAGRP